MPVAFESASKRSWKQAMGRGFMCRCPSCGHGPMFRSFLKVAETCPSCGEELHHHRADDAPPYFTMMIVGHIIVPAILVVEKVWRPELWIHAAIWIPATLLLSFALMPAVKGSIVGLQWAMRMHGFGDPPASA